MRKSAYGFGVLLCSLLLVLVFAGNANAMPAREETKQLVQPTGETFKATLNGNENLNWWTTEDASVIKIGKDNYWYYTEIVDQDLQLTNAKYAIDEKPSDAANLKEVMKLEPGHKLMAKPKDIPTEDQVELLSASEHPTLVLLVEFNDVKIKNKEADWSKRFFGASGSTLNNYYDEVSEGKLQFIAARETSGVVNDGVVKVSVNKNHPRPEGAYNQNQRYTQLFKDAVAASNAKVNYAQFDLNKDGYLSSEELHIVTIVAGGEASYGDEGRVVWGHMTNLYDTEAPRLDGVKIGAYKANGGYTMFGENHGDHMATVGIIAHEMGHDLGLPDLYDYDDSSFAVGIHSLMGAGSWTTANNKYGGEYPTHLDAWSKMVLGFVRPVEVQDNGTYQVTNFMSNDYSVLKLKTPDESEYFLVENRQFKGFDIGLAGYVADPGIAIWHIDEDQFSNGMGNQDETHKAVDLEEANESRLGYPELDQDPNQDPYPYMYYDHYYSGNGYAQFTNTSKPNSKLYSGSNSSVSVTVIDSNRDSMAVSVKVLNGEDKNPPVWPKNAKLTSSAITNSSITLNWPAATDPSGIASYIIYKNGSFLKEVNATTKSLKVQGLAANKEYTFKVEAVDKKGYVTANGPSLTAKTSATTTSRIEGLNRFETAARISKETFNAAETVVIAKGTDFPDALSGAPLAYQLNAPILLTKTDSLPKETADEIKRLKATKAIILGGENAISSSTASTIKSLGLEIERISGENRYETSAKIAKRMGGDPAYAVIAYGRNFPDALAIAPYAAKMGYPILLVESDKVPQATSKALATINDTIVVGGDQVITSKVYNTLPSPERISGENRFGTAAAVKASYYPDAKTAYLANGYGFADALSGSVLAGKQNAPLLLVKSNSIPPETTGAIKTVTDFRILGGEAAINKSVEDLLFQK
ncbi:cell wall-binding repeat-containing protein [Bacillus sp. NTK071]|uniref:cell wall-binding repeat-containing protein n=1 Tax=Bacillus sp. NTK071 TaxID=2802175 RepID=UPI001A8EC4C7|nr:cell wall-binding repeat-containing protein [Bacillus sp. NTK071]MBN8210307.1 cell wall-binding repeat-containing protein [Bacillus sp. NTK071]